MPATSAAQDYWSAEVHAVERQAIFGREWLCVGSAHAVAAPGSYVADEVAGWPVLVVRGGDGQLRAFHNVCRHRAGPLVDDGCGTCRSLVCRYHGWAYGLDGGLRAARDFGVELTDDERAELGLHRVHVDVWRGLLFVNFTSVEAAAGPPPLAEWLSGFADECAEFPMESWTPTERLVHDIACNWKAYGDNYLEGYHIPLVHPALSRAIDPSSYRVEVGDGWCRHRADTRAGTVATGAWLWHWPNLALNLYEHGMSVERWWPTSPTSCRLVLDFCFAPADQCVDDARERNRLDVVASDRICLEDKAICEAVQRNLQAGVYDTGSLSPKHEGAVAAFQRRVTDAVHR